MRTLGLLTMVVLILTVIAVPARATEFDFETEIFQFAPDKSNTFELEVGEVHKPGAAVWAEDGQCYSSDETVVTISSNGKVTAVSEGTAYVAIVAGRNLSKVYRYDVVAAGTGSNDSFLDQLKEAPNLIEKNHHTISTIQTVMVIIIAFLLLIGVAASVYIFITAPKCGMSRAWALAPVLSSVFGLIAFIIVRTASKATAAGSNTIVCPTCNAVHPAGTAVCNICGTKLQ